MTPNRAADTDTITTVAELQYPLFGGYAYDASGSSGRLNDLWKYHP